MFTFNYKVIFDSSPLPIYILQDGFFRLLNAKMAAITGYTVEELLQVPFELLIHPEDRPWVVKKALQRLAGDSALDCYEFRAINRKGELIFIKGFFSLIEFDSRPAILGQVMDITEQKRIENALRASEEKYRNVVENANEGIIVAQNGMIKFVNPKATEISGYSAGELKSRPFIDFIHSDDKNVVMERYERRLRGEKLPQIYPFRVLNKKGISIWVEINAVPVIWEGRPATLNFLSDITQRREAEEQLKYLSLHDPLTGLYNRTYFEQEMDRLEGGDRYKPFGIIICDVDGLKLVNDTLGHNTGDTLLVEAALAIKNSFRSGDMVARIGGGRICCSAPQQRHNFSWARGTKDYTCHRNVQRSKP